MAAEKLVDEGSFGAKLTGHRDQHHHDLPAGESPPNEHVPQKALSRFQIKGLDLHGPTELADGGQDGGGAGILQHAVLYLHDAAGGRLVDTRDYLTALGFECGLDLAAVVGGIIHADDLLHTAETAQETDELGLLEVELFLVGEILQRTASAFLGVRAGRHGGILSSFTNGWI